MKKYLNLFIVLSCLLVPSLSRAEVNLQLKQAIQLAYNAQFDQAESLLNSYVASNPDDPWGYITRGTANDWKQKIRNLKHTLDQKILADYQIANNKAFFQWDKDQENIDKMIALGNSYMYLSKKWLDMDKKMRAGLILKKCRTHLEKAIEKDPSRYEAYLAIGIFNFYAANIPPGLGFLASLMGISGNENEGLRLMGEAAAHENILQADALFMLAYAQGQSKGNYNQASTYLAQLTTMYPDNPYFQYLKGEFAIKAKKYPQARTDFQSYFSFCSTRAGACAFDFLANYYMSASFINENNLAAAAPYIEKSLAINTNQYPDRSARLSVMKGLLLKSQGKNDEAKAAFQSVKKEDNDKAWKQAQDELQGM